MTRSEAILLMALASIALMSRPDIANFVQILAAIYTVTTITSRKDDDGKL